MSMVYDPVTREFRPRETRGIKPLSGSDAAVIPQTAIKGGGHHSRRWQSIRRQRRRREMLFWFLVVTIAGALVWCTMLVGRSWASRYPVLEKPLVDRFWVMPTK